MNSGSAENAKHEPLELRYMGGIHCDMWNGPCACGAWHHPGSEFVSLAEFRERSAGEEIKRGC